MKKLIILCGPTAVGKTDLSIELAKRLNGYIISVDSMQIYKGMDIGTAKIKKTEMQEIDHFLLDIVNPDEDFTVSDYYARFREVYERNSNRVPILVGGTGLYINSVIYDMDFAGVKPDKELRDKLEREFDFDGGDKLYKYLKSVDPKSADKLSISDKNRIIRALEIYLSSGKTKSEFNEVKNKKRNDIEYTGYILSMPRDVLYERINRRVDLMLNSGLIKEVEGLLMSGYSQKCRGFKAIGYKETIQFLNGEFDYENLISKIKQHSRNYAKRQITWFKQYDDFKEMDLSSLDLIEALNIIENEYRGT